MTEAEMAERERAYDAAAQTGVTVAPAAQGEQACGKGYGNGGPRCGSNCIRKTGHDGLCLCVGDDGCVPGTCPA